MTADGRGDCHWRAWPDAFPGPGNQLARSSRINTRALSLAIVSPHLQPIVARSYLPFSVSSPRWPLLQPGCH